MHSLPINAQFLHKQKQQLPTSLYCTMNVFRRTNCNNCKPMWWCTEIVLRQLQCFLQFFFVLQELTNPTQLYVSFLCLAWCTKWLIMYEPNVAVLDTNSTGVSKTIVGFETPRKRLWNTRFVWFSCNIKLYINIQNILSVWGVFIF